MSTKTKERAGNSSAQVKQSSCVQLAVTPSLFGDDSLMTVLTSEQGSGKPELTAPLSVMNPRSDLPTSYVRHARSLLIAGLIAGITHTSIRKRCGADCRELALLPLDGDMCETPDIEREPQAAN